MRRMPREQTRQVDIPVSLVPLVEQFIAQGGVGCPFYRSAVPAGFPSPAQDDPCEFLDIVSYLVPKPDRTVLVKMPDDSWQSEGFFRGDILIAERGVVPRDGDFVLRLAEDGLLLTQIGLCGGRRDPDGEVWAVVRFRIHTLYGPLFF